MGTLYYLFKNNMSPEEKEADDERKAKKKARRKRERSAIQASKEASKKHKKQLKEQKNSSPSWEKMANPLHDLEDDGGSDADHNGAANDDGDLAEKPQQQTKNQSKFAKFAASNEQ